MEINGNFNPISAKRARDLIGVTTELAGKLDKTGGDVSGVVNFYAQPSMVHTDTTGIATSSAGRGAAEVKGRGAGSAAFMQFHRPGEYASYFGLDTDNQWKVGGWSAGAVARRLVHEGNPEIVGPLSVRTFGAKMDGSQDDYPAMQAARNNAQNGAPIVSIPFGPLNVSSHPSGTGNNVLWQNYTNNQLQYFGGQCDVIEGFNGSKYFGMGSSRHGAPSVLRVDQNITHSYDAPVGEEATIMAVKVNMTVGAQKLDDFPWALSTTLVSSAHGKGQGVGLASQVVRPFGATNTHPVFPQDHPVDRNRGKPIPCSPLWGLYVECADLTNLPSDLSGNLVGFELGVFSNGGDPDPGGRCGIDIGIGRRKSDGAFARVARGINFGTADYQYGYTQENWSYFGDVISVVTNFDNSVLNTTKALAIGNAPAIWMRDTHKIAFTTAGTTHLRYEADGYRFLANNVEVLTVLANGEVQAVGKGSFSRLRLLNCPQSPAGLSAGDIWVDASAGHVLKIV